MSTRIKQRFDALKQEKRAALVTFTMAYDPDLATSLGVLKSLPAAGADIIELGMPFSDPMADGPAIQEAGIRALKAGAKLAGVLDMARQFREGEKDTPLVLMGYYNPVQSFGLEKFVDAARDAGVDGLIIVDLPPEEDKPLFALTQKSGIALIKLVTPTTDEARLKVILPTAGGFLYYVAVAGVTGTKSASQGSIQTAVSMIKKHTDLPVAVGFGINTADNVAQVAKAADAVVVGSALVKTLSNKGEEAALAFVGQLAEGVR